MLHPPEAFSDYSEIINTEFGGYSSSAKALDGEVPLLIDGPGVALIARRSQKGSDILFHRFFEIPKPAPGTIGTA